MSNSQRVPNAEWFLLGSAAPGMARSEVRLVAPIFARDERVVIGRDRDCTLTLSDRTISRTHAYITVGRVFLELTDNGSRNGTRVNGRLLPPGVPQRLYGGERLELGDVTLTLVDAASWWTLVKSTQ